MRKTFFQAVVTTNVGVAVVARRHNSEARYDTPKTPAWPEFGAAPERPNVQSDHPTLKMRKTSVEWKLHHGNGVRYGTVGPLRQIADFEFADGTPSSVSGRRFALAHHQDKFLVQLIRAGAAVERRAAQGYLPRIPGTPEQRDWDPEIPLFLEDADEHGRAPTWHYTQNTPAVDIATEAISEQHVDSKFAVKTCSALANPNKGETLHPITMFASYDPSAFVSDAIRPKQVRPFWSRRRWNLSEEFLVSKSPQPKNTIKDE